MEKGEVGMLLHILGTVEIILFAWGILQMEFVKKKGNYLWAAIILFVGELFYQICPNINIGILAGRIFGQMLAVVWIYQESFRKRIIKYWFSLFYVTVFYAPIQLVISMVAGADTDSLLSVAEYYRVPISIVTCLLIVLVSRELRKKPKWVEWICSIPIAYYIIAIICAFSAQGISELAKEMSVTQSRKMQIFIWLMQIIICFFLYGLGIVLAFTDLLREQYKRESALKDEYLHMSKMHYEELANHMREVRSIRHDLKAHMNILEAYIGDEKWEQARVYLQEIKKHQEYLNYRQINVGNELVNAVIMDEIGRCKEDIKLECEGVLPKELVIADYDLCTIFFNLLSNSLEACRKLHKRDKRIVLQIKRFQNNLMVVVENPIEWDVPLDKLGEFTSKIDNERHGHGIYNIKKAVEKYNGQVDFFKDDEKFQVKILVPQAIYE